MEQRITRLGAASPSEVNAAVKVTHDNVSHLIDMFMTSGIAAMFKGQAKAQLESPQGKAWVVKLVDDALNAAEKVRQQETK